MLKLQNKIYWKAISRYKTISQKQIKGIKDAVNLYLAMGGSL